MKISKAWNKTDGKGRMRKKVTGKKENNRNGK